jgi:hypothetical protein
MIANVLSSIISIVIMAAFSIIISIYMTLGKEDSTDILGNSVESAMRAAQKVLYDFDHPLEPNWVISIEEQRALVKERQFYVSFLEKLEKLLTGNKEQNGTELYGAINRGILRSK